MIRTSRRVLIGTVGLVLVGLLATACSSNGGNGRPTGDAGSSGDIRLNVITDKSGIGGAEGSEIDNGVMQAVDEINAAGGVSGRKMSISFYDSQSNASTGASVARLAAPTSPVLLSDPISLVNENVFPIANSLKVPVIAADFADSAKVSSLRPWTFTTFPAASGPVKQAVQYWQTQTSVKNVAVIVSNGNQSAVDQASAAKDGLKAAGVHYTEVDVDEGQADYGAAVAKALSGGTDGVILATLEATEAAVMNSIKDTNPRIPLLATTVGFLPGPLEKAVSASRIAGVQGVLPFYADITPDAKKFAASFQSRTGGPPDSTAAFAYESVYLIAAGIKSGLPWSTSADARSKWSNYFNGLKWTGPLGPITIASGVVARKFHVVEVQADGSLKNVFTTA